MDWNSSKALAVVTSKVKVQKACTQLRDRPIFFDQVGHQTTNASTENKHFFTK